MFLLEEFVCLYFGPLGILLKLKKKAGSSFCCLENEAKKNFSGCHLTRTQKAAGPSEESMRNHPAWIVKCTVKDVRATRRYVFNILLICGLYSFYQSQSGSYQYGADAFTNFALNQ